MYQRRRYILAGQPSNASVSSLILVVAGTVL